QNYSPTAKNFDYFFSIKSEASVVDGPSAGSAMALLVIAALQDKPIPIHVGLTGTITIKGEVGPVGGVFEKAKEAHANGVKLFLIPSGESRQVVKLPGGVRTINLPDYALEEWGMKVIEVATLDEVLQFAYTDPDDLDISEINPPEPETFIPPRIDVSSSIQPLGEMNTRMIAQTRAVILEARTALSNSLLDDPGLIDVLHRSLSDSEKTINEAELLTQNGYYYSAGNFAFLAKVNAYFVLDVAANPELLDKESDELDVKIGEMLDRVEKQQKILDQIIPVEGVEWYIAAQQRLTWAQEQLIDLRSGEIIIVVTEDAQYVQSVQRVQDYEFARAWGESSQEFYRIGVQQSRNGITTQSPFMDYYADFVDNATQGLTLIQGDATDAQRRLNAAILDREMGRHLSAAMNGASALALVNAELMAQDPNTDLRSELENHIADLEKKMTGKDFAWPRLYLDHARFYLNSADHYREEGQGTLSASNIRSGLTLALLADYTYTVTEDVTKYYQSLPSSRFTPLSSDLLNGIAPLPLTVGPDGKGSVTIPGGKVLDLVTVLLMVGVVLAVFLVGISIYKTRRGPHHYAAASTILPPESALYRVDELEARLFAAKQGMRHAQFQRAQGKMPEKEYAVLAKHYQTQIRDISTQLRSGMIALRAGEKGKTIRPPSVGKNTRKQWPKNKTQNYPTSSSKKSG
ncbi:MAG: S16 family serine protease, partial [archaeon]|nr:S16 family serine protease [archaeon]